jgi:hypothetical protein
MDDQQSYKSSDLIEEETRKRYLKLFIGKLKYSLDDIFKRVQEEANLRKTEIYRTLIDLNCHKQGDDLICHKYSIITEIYYNKNNSIECYSDSQNPYYKFECAKYIIKSSNKTKYNSFELSDILQNFSSIQRIKRTIQDTFNMVSKGVLTNMDNRYNTDIKTVVLIYPKKSGEGDSQISIYGNLFKYNDNESKVKIAWYFYIPSKS